VPRFVVLEHTWRGVHWDLMLESGETLRTWAIDAPIVTETTLPARILPDHRLAYLEYEGPISWDRGTVRRLDRGTYEARIWTPKRVVVVLAGERFIGEAEVLAQDSGGSAGPLGAWSFRLGKVI
jgi:hypothetical protein